jgi:hypothetical protein
LFGVGFSDLFVLLFLTSHFHHCGAKHLVMKCGRQQLQRAVQPAPAARRPDLWSFDHTEAYPVREVIITEAAMEDKQFRLQSLCSGFTSNFLTFQRQTFFYLFNHSTCSRFTETRNSVIRFSASTDVLIVQILF